MKQISIKLLMIGLVLVLGSCTKYFEDSNTNPNSPVAVTPAELLPTIQLSLNYCYWGDGSRYLGLFTQHLTGVSRQFVAYNNYTLVGSNVDNMWSHLLYPKVLNNIKELRKFTDPATAYTYLGIADALEAYTLLFLTDCFGDIPYSEALKGLEISQPKFDTQESIFGEINRLISSAKTELGKPKSPTNPGANADLVYAGDPSKWLAFVNTLDARAKLRLAKRSGDYNAVLQAINNGAIAEGNDAKIVYGAASTANGPWFQYNQQRNDIAIGTRYSDLLTQFSDPRSTTYGAPLNENHPILTPDRAMPFLTSTEAAFISAEAKFRTNDKTAAYDDYLRGIKLSFVDANITVDQYNAYIAQTTVANGADNLTLEMIMTQKYIALYLDPEVFADWRRTDIPSLTPNSGTRIPRRLPYPETEVFYNRNCPSPDVVNIYTRVWWDNQ
ncbi:MAG: SusD/RagB family nutrient-binding outer membrane lipoprotein [Saprospiraceae bacterium]|nr:SusD/RagB family nutrient-binding outer membrane lipoprotein [Saprospiraceae bacterium]